MRDEIAKGFTNPSDSNFETLEEHINTIEYTANRLLRPHMDLFNCISNIESQVLELYLKSYTALRFYGITFVKEIIRLCVAKCDCYNQASKTIKSIINKKNFTKNILSLNSS